MFETFYRKLKTFAEARVTNCYVKRTGWNLRCPICKTWSAISGIEFLPDAEDGNRRYKCLQCERITHWHYEGPAAISVLTE